MLKRIGLLCGIFVLAVSAYAGIDTYEFESVDGRQRYNHFIDVLRCPECKNQNLAGSNSPIAQDLRRELHRLIEVGSDDDEITTFMVDRYGDFVLYDPPLQKNTYILWYAPAFMLLLGFAIIALIVWRRSKTPNSNGGLTDGEQERLEAFLQQTQINESNKK